MRRLVLVAGLLLAAGCGSEASPERAEKPPGPGGPAEVRATVRAYFAALSRGDVSRACATLTKGARRRLVADELTGGKACAHRLRASRKALPDFLRRRLRTVRLRDVEIEGAKATVSVRGGVIADHAERVALEAAGRVWRIAALPEAYNRDDNEVGCLLEGFDSWLDGSVDPFWRQEGQRDFEEYLRRICGRFDRVVPGSTPSPRVQFARITRDVLADMVREGRIADPAAR